MTSAEGQRRPGVRGARRAPSACPQRLAPFWCALLDVQVDATIRDGQFIVLSRTADGLTVGFQQVPEAKSMKNRLHLDLIVLDA